MPSSRPSSSLPSSPWRFLWMFVRNGFLGRAILLNLAAAGGIGLMGMEPVAMRGLVDALTGLSGAGSQPSGSPAWTAEVMRWFLLLGGLWIASALFNRLRELVDLHTSPALRHAIQLQLFDHLIDHSPRYFQDNFAGNLGQKVKQAGQSAIQILEILTNDIIRIVVILAIGLTLLASAQTLFAGLLVGWTVAHLGLSALLARRCLRLSHAFSEEVSSTTGRMVDIIANAELVRAFARRRQELSGLSDALTGEIDRSKELRWFLTKMWFWLFNALLVFQIILIGLAVSEAMAGRMSIGDFAMIFSLASIVGANVWGLSTRMLGFFEQLGILSGALDLIVRPHEIPDPPGRPDLTVGDGAIRFEEVRFAHPGNGAVFDGLSLTIRPGERVALVGPSGAGKSTLVRLLRRQFPLQGGRILIDGQDIAAVSLASLNRAVAEVPQLPSLFHRSIRDNIAYGSEGPDGKGVADEAIRAAAARAHCDRFIEGRAAGYDTVVGERGIQLSGGERQRVAIARAFLKDAPILVLDEATSSLDSETEHLIQDALLGLFEGRTVIAIAHRLSTVTGMDRILYMEKGRILEDGDHATLLRRDGPYARLWRRQVGGFLPDDAGSTADLEETR
ncbi:ABC transporter ATP-binding protein [Azospirillum sp. TSH64]|uniref:ABC transporter ATP-binding protein n=1 Tax=Azospirillum sp. TSH64 TaxID=652740 RepID=UPI000D622628|nr:ABC transporter ATP-binding protein [Azospirillum sp. TSH64]PWC73929.1 ABC transporter [Azospirillum sp. TSH64]PWC81434.1 ABC transporter [Azospirillum sp. TSH64]